MYFNLTIQLFSSINKICDVIQEIENSEIEDSDNENDNEHENENKDKDYKNENENKDEDEELDIEKEKVDELNKELEFEETYI